MHLCGTDPNGARTSQAEAAAQAADALQKLATDRATHANQIALLQESLAAATRKAHDLELNLVRAETLAGKEQRRVETRKSARTGGQGIES